MQNEEDRFGVKRENLKDTDGCPLNLNKTNKDIMVKQEFLEDQNSVFEVKQESLEDQNSNFEAKQESLEDQNSDFESERSDFVNKNNYNGVRKESLDPLLYQGEGEEAEVTPTLILGHGDVDVVSQEEDVEVLHHHQHDTDDDDDNDDDNDDDYEEDEQPQSSDQAATPRPPMKRRKKNPSVILSDEQERVLALWLETEGEYIYNRGRKAYKDKAKIRRAFEKQGAKLDPPVSGEDLRTWYSSLRSRYGRLTNNVSGQATTNKRLTDREKWILELFPFLRPHIVRQHRTAHLGLSQQTDPVPGPSGLQQEAQKRSVSPTHEEPEEQPTPALGRPRSSSGKPGEALGQALQTVREAINDLGQLREVENPLKEHWRSFFNGLMTLLLKIKASNHGMFMMELTAAASLFSELGDGEGYDNLRYCQPIPRAPLQRAPEPPRPPSPRWCPHHISHSRLWK